jgi:hypothetical protein
MPRQKETRGDEAGEDNSAQVILSAAKDLGMEDEFRYGDPSIRSG